MVSITKTTYPCNENVSHFIFRYVCCLPFEVCIEAVKGLNEILYKGVRLPFEVAVRLKEGKNGW